MTEIPCGRVMGHGESCTEGYLCDSCVRIKQLENTRRIGDRVLAALTEMLLKSADRFFVCNEHRKRIYLKGAYDVVELLKKLGALT